MHEEGVYPSLLRILASLTCCANFPEFSMRPRLAGYLQSKNFTNIFVSLRESFITFASMYSMADVRNKPQVYDEVVPMSQRNGDSIIRDAIRDDINGLQQWEAWVRRRHIEEPKVFHPHLWNESAL
jgi:hypothetical protein